MTAAQMRTAYRQMDAKLLAQTPLGAEFKQMADDSADFTDAEVAALYADNFALAYGALQANYPQVLKLDAHLPKRKPTAREVKRRQVVEQRAKGKKKVKATQREDGKAFAERMRAAREAKKQATAPVDQPSTSGKKPKKAKTVDRHPVKNDQNAPKASKAAKTPTLKPGDQAYLNAGHVLVLPVEAKHFKKYVSLSQKGTKEQLVEALNALQRDIQKKVLRKTDKNSALLMQIQREYLALLDTKKAPYRPGQHMADVQALADGTKVYKSVDIMLAVTGWNEKDKTAAQCKKLLSTIRNAKAKGKIKSTDPYAGEVDQLETMLEKATSGRKFLAEQVDLAGLRGLAGLGSVPVSPVPAVVPVAAAVPTVMSSADMQNLKYDTYRLTGRWLSLLGLVSKNFKVMIWGEPGQGKSTLSMQLARYLASDFAPVLYCSSEEFPSYTLTDKLKRVGGAVQGWDFSKSVSALTPRHKFLVLDSVNHFGWTLAELKALALARPDLSIILVFHATKGGDFKGGKDWEHEVDTVIHAYAPGQAKTTKNRFAALAEVTTF